MNRMAAIFAGALLLAPLSFANERGANRSAPAKIAAIRFINVSSILLFEDLYYLSAS